jgi:glycerol-3-phosphate dehydrogenase
LASEGWLARQIGGGRDFPRTAAAEAALLADIGALSKASEQRCRVLLERYGTRARLVAPWLNAPDNRPIGEGERYSTGEIAFLCREEHALRLADILFRRTEYALAGEADAESIEAIAKLAADVHGWAPEKLAAELAHTHQEFERRKARVKTGARSASRTNR